MVIKAGVIGHPIGHSLSPRIHRTWFEACGVEGRYEAVDAPPAEFELIVRKLMDQGWAGVNVTLPHKPAAAALADHASDEVQLFGAANLLVFRDGQIEARNTDHVGFRRCLEAFTTRQEGRAVVIGAGGAAPPVLHALQTYDQVAVINRTLTKANALADRFGPAVNAYPWSDLPGLMATADLVVNTTSLGMTGQPPLEVDLSGLGKEAKVIDIIYTPLETPLLAQARGLGLEAMNGLPMLVHQAAPSFEAFTGLAPPEPDQMTSRLTEMLS